MTSVTLKTNVNAPLTPWSTLPSNVTTHTHMQIITHLLSHICIYIYICIHIHICIYIHIYICICICIYI